MPDIRVEAPIYLESAHTALGEIAYASAWAEGQGDDAGPGPLAYTLGTMPDRQV